jgi:rubrerythrin
MNRKSVLMVILSLLVMAGMGHAKDLPAKAATVINIKEAIKGETTASAKYAAYAEKARAEGFDKVALLFEAASKSEGIHANNHRAALEQLGESMEKVTPEFEVKSTKENLQDAVNGESYEVATMYPGFIKTANKAGVSIALISFNYAYQTEKKHKALYQNALNKLNEGKENTLSNKYMVCTTCGNTYDGDAPNRCGISMTPKERFLTIQ